MTIALNILLAVIVLVGVVGLLAFNIVALREPQPPRRRQQRSRERTPTRRSVAARA